MRGTQFDYIWGKLNEQTPCNLICKGSATDCESAKLRVATKHYELFSFEFEKETEA